MDRTPVADISVRHERVGLTIVGIWPKTLGGGQTNAAGEVELAGVQKNDYIHMEDSDWILTRLWPDDELFRPKKGDERACSLVYFRLMRQWTLEARNAASPQDSKQLIVVPILGHVVDVYDDAKMEKLDPNVPAERMKIYGLGNTDRGIAMLMSHRNIFFVEVLQTSITDEGLVNLASIPTLMAIDLSENKLITDRGVERALALRPDIVIRRP